MPLNIFLCTLQYTCCYYNIYDVYVAIAWNCKKKTKKLKANMSMDAIIYFFCEIFKLIGLFG